MNKREPNVADLHIHSEKYSAAQKHPTPRLAHLSVNLTEALTASVWRSVHPGTCVAGLLVKVGAPPHAAGKKGRCGAWVSSVWHSPPAEHHAPDTRSAAKSDATGRTRGIRVRRAAAADLGRVGRDRGSVDPRRVVTRAQAR